MMRVDGSGVSMMLWVVVLGGALGAAANAGATEGKPVTMSGRVVDGTGQPLAGAKVTCYEDTYSVANRRFDGLTVGELVTQADGKFSFRVDPKDPGYRYGYIIADKAGFSLGFAGWSMEADQQSDIALGEPKTLAGVVVDESGAPVPQAAVSVSAMAIPGQMDRGLARSVGPKVLTTSTGAEGRFAFTNLPAGTTVEFMVRKPGRASIDTFAPQPYAPTGFQYPVGQADIKLVLPAEAKIEGIVVNKDSGRPVPAVMLRVMQQGSTPLYTHDFVTSGPDGSFTIDSLPAGSHRLALVIPPPREGMTEWVALPMSVPLEAGQTRKDVRMEVGKGSVLEIQVARAGDSKPVAGASIGLQYSGKDYWGGAESDANGLARIRLVPGTYKMQRVYAPGYTGQPSNPTITVVEGQTHRMNVTLQEMPKISGVVRDPNGTPIAGVGLSVLPGGGSRADVVSGPDGEFSITWDPSMWGEREMTFCLLARDPDRHLAAAVGMGKDERTINVKLVPATTLAGRVLDPDGKGIATARVIVLLQMSNWGSPLSRDPVRTDADGNFQIGGMIPDQRYSVEASADGYGSRRVMVQGETAANRLEVEPLTLPRADLSVSGQVVDMEGNPIPRVMLTGYGEGQPSRVSTQTDAEGKFVFPSVCAGQLNIRAQIVHDGKLLSAYVVTDGGAADIRMTMREGNSPVQRVGGRGYDQIIRSAEKVIAGVVVDESGSPVAGVPVGVRCHKREKEGRMTWTFSSFNNLKATTDNQGRFAIALEDDGEYNLLFSPDRHAATIAYDVPCNTKDLKVVLEKGGIVEGRLFRQEKGQKVPVPNAEVKIEQTDRASYTHLGFDRDRVTTTDAQGRFRFEHMQTKIRPSSSRSQKEWQPEPRIWQVVSGGVTKSVTFPDSGRIENFELLIKPDPQTAAPLTGRPLPGFDRILIDLSQARTEGSAVLVCFFDFQQRPSRNTVLQLAQQADALKQQGITVIAVQVAGTDQSAVDSWRTENGLSIPVGFAQGDGDEIRFAWGIKTVPWLVLADKDHIVTAEGFGLDELSGKIKQIQSTK